MDFIVGQKFCNNPKILLRKIGTTEFTTEWILEKIFEQLADLREKVENVKIKDIEIMEVSCNSGFMANVYRAIIEFEDDKKFRFILKIPSVECFYSMMNKVHSENENEKSMTKIEITHHMERFHNKECEFYNNFSIIPGFPMPKVYFSQKFIEKLGQQGVLLMEDLCENGQLVNILNDYSVEQIKTIVDHLASFHAFFLSLDESKWKNQFLEINQIPILQLEGFKGTPKKLAKLRPGVFDDLLEKLHAIFSDEMMRWTYQGCCKDLNLPSTMCHGDLWSNNMFWGNNPDGTPSNQVRAFFDLQLTFEGNPALDLTRVIVINTSTQTRKDLETFIFEYYLDRLRLKMARNGQNLPKYWNAEMMKKGYYAALPTEAGLLTTITAFFIDDSYNKNADPKHDFDAKVEKLILRSRNALEDALEILEKDHSKWLKF